MIAYLNFFSTVQYSILCTGSFKKPMQIIWSKKKGKHNWSKNKTINKKSNFINPYRRWEVGIAQCSLGFLTNFLSPKYCRRPTAFRWSVATFPILLMSETFTWSQSLLWQPKNTMGFTLFVNKKLWMSDNIAQLLLSAQS